MCNKIDGIADDYLNGWCWMVKIVYFLYEHNIVYVDDDFATDKGKKLAINRRQSGDNYRPFEIFQRFPGSRNLRCSHSIQGFCCERCAHSSI